LFDAFSSREPVSTSLENALIILQQPLDIVELDLRTLGIGEAAAKLLQNPAYPLYIDFAGNLHRQVIAEFAPVQGPS
jgi:hypothetical protein